MLLSKLFRILLVLLECLWYDLFLIWLQNSSLCKYFRSLSSSQWWVPCMQINCGIYGTSQVSWPIMRSWYISTGLRWWLAKVINHWVSMCLVRKINMASFIKAPNWILLSRSKKILNLLQPSNLPPDYSSPYIELLRFGTSLIGNLEVETVKFGWLLIYAGFSGAQPFSGYELRYTTLVGSDGFTVVKEGQHETCIRRSPGSETRNKTWDGSWQVTLR